jgi:16S rRNA (adenine1518-N6/adenine1519-N6)-dimethyltransferase
VRARKRFGQHFLEPAWVHKVVQAIAPHPNDRFLEIGPGRGALTLPLAAAVSQVIAVEVDRDLAASLRQRLPTNVRVIEGDFLATDLALHLGPPDASPWRVAGNLPYNITAPILARLFRLHEEGERVSEATLMVQREVADRLSARPGTREYGVLTVTTQRLAHVERVLDLPPGAFRPAPKVHSALVRLTFRTGAERIEVPSGFDGLVRSVFTQRRKRLSNALRPFAESVGRSADVVLKAAAIDGGRRPETLSLAEFVQLATVTLASAPAPWQHGGSERAREHR